MGKIGTQLGRHWRATKAARACGAKIPDRREMSGGETDIPCHLPAGGICWLMEGSRAQAESSSSVWGAVLPGWGVKQNEKYSSGLSQNLRNQEPGAKGITKKSYYSASLFPLKASASI